MAMMQPLRLMPCPRCEQPVSSERVACRACGSPHHPECWVQGRGCGHYACANHPEVAPPPAMRRPILRAMPRPPREPLSSGAYAVGLAGALALVFFGLIALTGRDLHPPQAPGLNGLAPALMTAGFFAGPSILHVHGVTVDLGTAPTVSWDSDRKHTPVFRFGRDLAEKELPVRDENGRHAVSLPELEPGATYCYRISGWRGGGALEGRFVAPPPGNPAPVSMRTQLLDLPDGGTVAAPTFGAQHVARPLWARRSIPTEVALARDTAILHDGRHVYGLDATSGAVRWTHPAPRPAPYPPLVVDGAVVVLADEGPLALEIESGRPRWRLPLSDVASVWTTGDEVYVHQPGPPARLHRVQAADGRLVSILPLPEVSHRVQVSGEHVLVQIDEPGDSRGELLIRAQERLRGGQRWEKLLFGDALPVLPPITHAGRLYLALKARIEQRDLATGEITGSWDLPAPALAVLPWDGGAVVCTGGPVPKAHLLDAQAQLKRSWTLPSPVSGGTIAGERAALVDSDGVQILELTAGPRWAIGGWSGVTGVSDRKSVV